MRDVITDHFCLLAEISIGAKLGISTSIKIAQRLNGENGSDLGTLVFERSSTLSPIMTNLTP